MKNEHKAYLTGIRGWLILPAIGIVLTIPNLLLTTIQFINELLLSGELVEFTSPDSIDYIPGFDTMFIILIICNSLFLLCYCYLAYLFFTKNHRTPKWIITLYIVNLLLVVFSIVMASIVIGVPIWDAEYLAEIIKAIIVCAIWIPYFLISVRVKNTFVNGKPNNGTIIAKSNIVN